MSLCLEQVKLSVHELLGEKRKKKAILEHSTLFNLDPYADAEDAETFPIYRSRIPTSEFKKIVEDCNGLEVSTVVLRTMLMRHDRATYLEYVSLLYPLSCI
jgi:hypothetical protein